LIPKKVLTSKINRKQRSIIAFPNINQRKKLKYSQSIFNTGHLENDEINSQVDHREFNVADHTSVR
jgi:hypothetical protein